MTKIDLLIDADCGKYYKRIENVCVNISNEAISDQSQIETNCKAIGALPMVIDSSAAFYQLKVYNFDSYCTIHVQPFLFRKYVTPQIRIELILSFKSVKKVMKRKIACFMRELDGFKRFIQVQFLCLCFSSVLLFRISEVEIF